eukprot:640661-Pelagomonas_calceolata.AAC.3
MPFLLLLLLLHLAARALPLYQRALAIYEKHFGPDHPEVAHTLTDLAVLHLEQVGLWTRTEISSLSAGSKRRRMACQERKQCHNRKYNMSSTSSLVVPRQLLAWFRMDL